MSVPLVLIFLCLASAVLADDFKTINGKEYKNATVSRVEPDGIVIKSKAGISKIYFTELPKQVQERFHYADNAKVAADAANERAQKRAKDRADKAQKASAILTNAAEEYETAEKRAAHAYETSEKGTLSGQVFVATEGGQNFKLGAVYVSLFAGEAINIVRGGLSAYVTEKTAQLQLDIAQAEEEKKQAQAAEEQLRIAEKQAQAAVQQAGATERTDRELYQKGYSTLAGRPVLMLLKQQ